MKSFNYLLGLLLVLVSQWASAFPLLTATDDSGYPGDLVSVVLSDPSPLDLDSASIDIRFDPLYLSYNSVQTGSLANFFITDDLTDVATGVVFATLSAPNQPINSGSGSLIEVSFTILNTAPFGDTWVTFNCHDYGQGVGCFDYAFDPAVAAKITVLARTNQAPLPATLWLLALGLPALMASRARQ